MELLRYKPLNEVNWTENAVFLPRVSSIHLIVVSHELSHLMLMPFTYIVTGPSRFLPLHFILMMLLSSRGAPFRMRESVPVD